MNSGCINNDGKQRQYMGGSVVLFPNLCYFSSTFFVHLYRKYISFKAEFFKIPSFLKKHKMTFIVNVKLLFDQSHFNFSANNQIPETYNGHYNISHNISDSLSFLLKSKEKLYLL